METDEGLYHATPQTQGRIAHEAIDSKKSSTRKNDILALPVFSSRLGIMGKIDTYRKNEKHLIERKYRLKQIYQGQLYQLWGQCFCLQEMGYEVKKVSFYEISTNTMMPQKLPGETEYKELKAFVGSFMSFDPNKPIEVNENKCLHCIYCPLCEKTTTNNVYE